MTQSATPTLRLLALDLDGSLRRQPALLSCGVGLVDFTSFAQNVRLSASIKQASEFMMPFAPSASAIRACG